MYTWDRPYEKLLNQARHLELSNITKASYYRGYFTSFMQIFSRISICLTTICFIFLGNQLTPNKYFLLAECFNVLQMITAIYGSEALSYGAEALTSFKRLRDFLIMDEREIEPIVTNEDSIVELVDVSASWTSKTPTLENITLTIQPGTLCVIVGSVGSGKSSLLQVSIVTI